MVQYHFRTKEGPSVGPINTDEFRQHLEAGEITDATMVWRSGLIDWTNYAALRAFEEEMARKRATPPPLPARQVHHEGKPQEAVKHDKAVPVLKSGPASTSNAAGNGTNASHPILRSKARGGWVGQALTMVAVLVVCCGVLLGALWLRYIVSKGNRAVQQEVKFTSLPAR